LLFDLRGRRKRLIQVTYLILAVLFGAGLVLFGVGTGGGPGGLLDAFKNSGANSSSVFDQSIKSAKQKTVQDPRDRRAWLELARAEFNLSNSPVGTDQNTGQLSDKGQQAAVGGVDAWEHYLKLKPAKANAAVAQFAAQAYGSLGDASGALKAQQIVVDQTNTAIAWSQLALYAYADGKNGLGDRAQARTLKLTPKDQRNTVQATLKGQEKQAKSFYKNAKKQEKAQKKGGGQQGTTPGQGFGPLPGQSGGASGGAGL
jgi:hypothetical protein